MRDSLVARTAQQSNLQNASNIDDNSRVVFKSDIQDSANNESRQYRFGAHPKYSNNLGSYVRESRE